ncbi:trace amine-associated receptor 3-like [Pangasianodon hypophthalmus]|uniref:trace amine-associated receptor 3-like n=1 Tax=Pangasianodon hypophthalmus TaxID=310915 RepID=UPI00230818D1|nr:trace amine-associated receptor 3-like [Pangasianodon hypophthalmus]
MEDYTNTVFAHLDYRCVASWNTSCSSDFQLFHLNHSNLIVFFFFSVVSVLTVSGNVVVIVSITISKQLRTATNFVILSLAMSDFLVGALMMPLQCIMLVDGCLYHTKHLCPVYHFISTIIGTVSLYNVILIAIDRYFALCHPFRYVAKMSVRVVLKYVGFGWILSFFYNLSMMYTGNSEQGERKVICIQTCAIPVNNAWGFIDFIFIFIVPCLLIIILYVKVFTVALRHAKVISDSAKPGLGPGLNRRKWKSEIKATKTLGTVVFVYLVCWIPWYIFLVNIENVSDSNVILNYLMCLFYSNAFINPIIYAISSPWFKNSLKFCALFGK